MGCGLWNEGSGVALGSGRGVGCAQGSGVGSGGRALTGVVVSATGLGLEAQELLGLQARPPSRWLARAVPEVQGLVVLWAQSPESWMAGLSSLLGLWLPL